MVTAGRPKACKGPGHRLAGDEIGRFNFQGYAHEVLQALHFPVKKIPNDQMSTHSDGAHSEKPATLQRI